MKVFPKHKVNWITLLGEEKEPPWRDVRFEDNPVNFELALVHAGRT